MLPDIGNTKLGLCDLFDGCVGEGGGREVKREGAYVCLWPIHVDISQKLSQYCNVIILPFKIILKKKILERFAISFSNGLSQPRDQTCASCIGRQILYS